MGPCRWPCAPRPEGPALPLGLAPVGGASLVPGSSRLLSLLGSEASDPQELPYLWHHQSCTSEYIASSPATRPAAPRGPGPWFVCWLVPAAHTVHGEEQGVQCLVCSMNDLKNEGLSAGSSFNLLRFQAACRTTLYLRFLNSQVWLLYLKWFHRARERLPCCAPTVRLALCTVGPPSAPFHHRQSWEA